MTIPYFFIIGVSWHDIECIKIDIMVPYLRYRIINLILHFFLYIKLNRMFYLLVMYDTQSDITIETKYVWVA
jgi:hypothetical protein